MKRDDVNYLLVGLVVAAALGLLFVVLLRITGSGGASDRYHVYYRNVSGLGFGTPVLYEGFRIGEVVSVHPERGPDGTRYRVELRVQRGWAIPEDSSAQLMASGLLSDVVIGIREGRAQRLLQPGSEIPGRDGGDLFVAIQELAGEATWLSRERLVPLLELLSARIDSITGKIDGSTAPLIEDVRGLLARLNGGAESLEQLLGPQNRRQLERLLEALLAMAGQGQRLASDLHGSRERLDALLGELERLAVDSRPALTEASEDLRELLALLAQRVDAISHQLESASRNVNAFSREIRRNPNRLLFSPPDDDPDREPAR